MLSGLLFFPVTPFDGSGELALGALKRHVQTGVSNGAGAVFAACGTGEFHALSVAEYREVTREVVDTVACAVPVVVGVGGALPAAIAQAEIAARNGVDGVLLLPPYLVRGSDVGLYDYVAAVAGSTDLPVIVYQRDNAVFSPGAAVRISQLPTVVGFKDGTGDIEAMQRIVAAVTRVAGPAFQFFNGMPTAEVFALPYASIGIPLYSSAAFCFVPEVATAFYSAMSAGRLDDCRALLDAFYFPFADLRQRQAGYAVSLVKAGMRLRGQDVGSVRPPLSDPGPADLGVLETIIAAGLRAAASLDSRLGGRELASPRVPA